MMKIGANIKTKAQRYFSKSTVRARYNRQMDLSTAFALGTFVQLSRLPSWDFAIDGPITGTLAAFSIGSAGNAIKYLADLQPIRKRAIRIKKAAKLAAKEAKKLDKKA